MSTTFNINVQNKLKNIIGFKDKTEDLNSKELLSRFLIKANNISKAKFNKNAEFADDIFDIILNDTGACINTLISGIALALYSPIDEDLEDIRNDYGLSVEKIIRGLLKIPLIKTEKLDKQPEKYIQFLLTITEDVRSVLVLLAFQIYKVRNAEKLHPDEQKIVINQAVGLYIPLAHRVGLYNIKTELEERVMKYTERDMYRFIAQKLKETKANRDSYIKNFIEPIKEVLSKSGYSANIKGRPKSIHSIWNKMKSQNVPFEEVYDLFAIRIILKSDINNEKAVCWNVYSIITDLYKPNPNRLRDWISSPKLSGYESLHATVLGPENKWLEVQIRTERMDEIAEKGPAAHWRYKAGKEGSGSGWLSMIRDALENPFIDDLDIEGSKSKLYSEEILVFTPEGDLKSLKKDYTVLDFAFQIHTKVGETCSGAIVNGKIQPLSYELKNGDTVKILTNKNKKPNQEWLKIAKGTRTKNKIKRALKSITYNYANVGKDIIKEKLERLKIGFSEKSIELLTDYFKLKSAIEFYHKIGEGSLDVSKIKQAFEDAKEIEKVKPEKPDEYSEITEDIKSDDFLLIDENISDLDYKFAKCCNPLPGESIFGFVTVNKGTKIHKSSCPNAFDMKSRYPYRVVKAKWNIKDGNFSFSVNLFLTGVDSAGITSQITDVISKEFNLKMLAINLKSTGNNFFEGNVTVRFNNKKQLIDLVKRLRLIKGIRSVTEKA